MRLHRLVRVYTGKNATLLEITCRGSYNITRRYLTIRKAKIEKGGGSRGQVEIIKIEQQNVALSFYVSTLDCGTYR